MSTPDHERPVILSCGDPSGIGPELAARAWEHFGARLPFVWLGDPAHLPRGTKIREIAQPSEAVTHSGSALPVLPHAFPAAARPGDPDPENARAVIDVIARGVDLVMRGEGSALTTAPIHKKALKDGAGFAFPGHTEFLAHLAGVERVVMMLASSNIKPPLRVVPATIHIGLSEVPSTLTPQLLRDTVRITNAGLRADFGFTMPRIAIAGLNPHAGEGGAMGREELDWIRDEIASLRAEGFALSGPLPADTLFHDRARSRYDAVICAYHDQALIPIKTLDFDGGVNVTLGLPFVRTSPDHGTAYDIAGQGRANPASLIAALEMAARMGAARHG
ncbi:4-hydroxythreonine-4-phosphate dehydrogenase PdxA [Thioclava sp. BHET1]|uniref:4-hydroxythreonine-4-phosphate dehydrogenase n=1 Tax=Thioclava dalianensis TaxID=1185766 RepID=A0A074TEF6_9RHOB|nr:4-hydroxythreonine-4-phosphate dehydrogenase PdxA [Thioclava dalianensis]KEP68560.1 4-hydroxythreonine-4-phosphate dehydrogenase [Thioclava dalianensis]TMV91687.1 4-hydroxythreonine-4-phosphate dehydrogenase PdxA [Thioclava sp. BHET1]SFN58048.1 4-hydroxythreonine-4-phosphate dehydrogenase [Thioclava dalianensis]